MAEYTFIYPSVPDSEADFMRDLNDIAVVGDFSPPLRQAFMVVLSEAFTNALIHGNQKDPSRSIHLRVEVTNSEVIADISDEGKRGLERIRRRQPAPPMADHGRGLALIEYYARDCEFGEAETGGLKVTASFDRKPEKITS